MSMFEFKYENTSLFHSTMVDITRSEIVTWSVKCRPINSVECNVSSTIVLSVNYKKSGR